MRRKGTIGGENRFQKQKNRLRLPPRPPSTPIGPNVAPRMTHESCFMRGRNGRINFADCADSATDVMVSALPVKHRDLTRPHAAPTQNTHPLTRLPSWMPLALSTK